MRLIPSGRQLAAFTTALLALALPTGAAENSEALPGAPAFPEGLGKQLAAGLAARGADYVPRTRNLRPDGSPRFTNRLVLETSPYLLQHAHNPVNWYPWGDEAFAAAKQLGRPVLVSIGYSTCHWCHVMEEESFDDPELAAFLNEHFVAIKVDREARPDVDAVYMAAIHAMNKSGGWPLNIWVTPDRKPFFGGTYFPPDDRAGRPGFRSVLDAIRKQYAAHPESVAAASDQITAKISESLEGYGASSSEIPERAAVDRSSAAFASRIDETWGGIGRRNKFPSTVPVRLMLRVLDRNSDPETLRLVELTLDKMAAGGMRDHVGGGFHRYSTDPRWLVPHFEKMLYDNALLTLAYIEAYQATGRDDYARIARETLDYVAREMTAPEGGFYSATDADSLNPSGEAEEGWFFTWTPAEIQSVVGQADAKVVNAYFGVTDAGNFEGRSILHGWKSTEEVAAELKMKPADVRSTVESARNRLLAARSSRKAPLRDDKVLAAWNGLMISAFARVGFVLDERAYTQAAARAAAFVLDDMRKHGRLFRLHREGAASGPAFLEDYAFLIAGLLDLYEADSNTRWLSEAVALQAVLDTHYADATRGGYYKTANDTEKLLAREKPGEDGAVPAGNSVTAMNLLRLAEFTTDDAYHDRAFLLFAAFNEALTKRPTQLPEMLMAVEYFFDTTKEVVLVRPDDGKASDPMLRTLRSTYVPNRVIAIATEGDDLKRQAELVPLLAGRVARGGKTTAYVCENRVCGFPTTDPETFATQLRKRSPAE